MKKIKILEDVCIKKGDVVFINEDTLRLYKNKDDNYAVYCNRPISKMIRNGLIEWEVKNEKS